MPYYCSPRQKCPFYVTISPIFSLFQLITDDSNAFIIYDLELLPKIQRKSVLAPKNNSYFIDTNIVTKFT